jgi:predicted ATP-dependent serine protease
MTEEEQITQSEEQFEHNKAIQMLDDGDIVEQVPLFDSSDMQSVIDGGKKKPPIHRLWGDFWWENELVFLFADSGIGKSILATQIAYEIAKGESECVGVESEPQTVLYFDFELSDRQLARRYGNAKFPKSLIRCTISENMDSDYFSMNVIDGIKDKLIDTGAKVMILDNLSYLSTQTAEAEYAGIIMDGLTRLKREMKISIMVIAHTPKIEEWKPLSKTNMAGSKILSNFADGVFAIGRTKVGGRYLKLLKTRMVSEPDEKSLLPYFNIVSEPYLHFEKVGDETERKLLMGKPAKEFFSSIWDRGTTEPIPLGELVKLIVSKDNSKNTDKAKDGNARKRIERGIKYGTLKKDELKNIYLKTEE